MRIVLVAGRYWPAVGGVESYLRAVAHRLAHDHDVTVVARSIGGDAGSLWMTHDDRSMFEPFHDGPVRVEPLDVPPRAKVYVSPLLLSRVPKAARLTHTRARTLLAPGFARTVGPHLAARLGPADVVHSWSAEFVGVAAYGLSRSIGASFVVTSFPHRGQYGDGPLDGWVYRRADACLSLLETDASVYLDLGVDRSRVHVVGVGIDDPRVESAPLPSGMADLTGPVVAFLGVRRPYKGADILRAAAPLVRGQIPGATIVFAGPGTANTAESTDGVVDLGELDDSERSALLARADVLCLPSEHEIFPVSFLEAWRHDVAVVGSDIPSLSELCARSGGGVTVEREPSAVARTLVRLLTDHEERSRLAQAGRTFAESYGTIDAAVDRHVAAYSSVRRAEGDAA